MAVAKRNLEEIGESLENMGMNDRPSLLNTEMAKSEEDKNISKGGTNFVNISAREILVEPIKLKAPKYILIHNHPGRSTKPSRADIETTKSLYKASQILGIELLDHIILAGENYTSIMSDWIAREELEEL